jgi:hypothetical protein
MFVSYSPMADAYAVTITNANSPREAGAEDRVRPNPR